MRALILAILLLWPIGLAAQDKASLIADSVAIAGDDVLVAEGNVEVFYQGRRLTAPRIVYDAAADRLTIEGPIVLSDPDGTVILADQADLADDLSEGLLTSARLVFDQQLQLASSEILRVGNRYTRLGQTVASSCKVCAGDATPLWEIRASRVIHDSQTKQLYFDNAQLRFGGVPVAWIPRLRVPDPSLSRARGFLLPEVVSSTGLGTGLRLPYFIPIGPSRDLTLIPFASANNARTLGYRYRQAFRTGEVQIDGALSTDNIRPDETRGYVAAEGVFALPRGFTLEFDGIAVSDRGYLNDYGLGNEDRLESSILISRTTADEYIAARLINFSSIREGDVNERLPSLVGDLTWQQRLRPDVIGGIAGLTFQTHAHNRASTSGTDSDGDGIADGRDLTRATVAADWRRDATFGPGLVGAALVDLTADIYDVQQDDVYEGTNARLTGTAAVQLSWPLIRATAKGATQVFEPVVQLAWTPDVEDDAIPNEDSVLPEFDDGNLFALDMLPGEDAVETGARATVGLSFSHITPQGWSLGFSAGRIYRADGDTPFSKASGLDGMRSDWLATFRVNAPPGLLLAQRLVFDDDLDLTKGEVRLGVERETVGLATSYVWMLADPDESRDVPVSELDIQGRYRINDAWTTYANARYDFEADRAGGAGLQMEWTNECLKVDLSLSRRFASSTSVQPTTVFGLSVELLGLGGRGNAGPARACRG